MKLEAICKVDVDDLAMSCSSQEAMKFIKLLDEHQHCCDFTYEVARVMIKRLEKELGKGNDYSYQIKAML